MTVSLELDRAARARGLASRASSRPGRRGSRSPAGGSPSTPSSPTSSPEQPSGSSSRARARRGAAARRGAGAVSHPAYSGVTLGLIHGSAPHAFVLCHLAGTTEVEGYPGHPLLPLRSSSSCTSGSRCPRGGEGRGDRAQHARPPDDAAPARRSRPRRPRWASADDPSASGRRASSTRSSRPRLGRRAGPLGVLTVRIADTHFVRRHARCPRCRAPSAPI